MKAADFLRDTPPPERPRSARDFLAQPGPPPPRQNAAAFLRGDPVQAVPRDTPTPPAAPAAPLPPPARATAASGAGVQPDLSLSVRPPTLIPPGEPIRRAGLTPLPELPGAPAPAPLGQPATPQFLRDLLPAPATPSALATPDQPRLPETVLADIQAGREGMTARELADLLAAFERPDALADPAAARQLLALRLEPEQLQQLDDALRVREILAELPADSATIPGGPATETFLESLVRGATLNMVEPEQPTGPPGTEIERLLRQSGRAQDIAASERTRENWPAALAGDIVGGSLPWVRSVQLLRSLRAAPQLRALEAEGRGISGAAGNQLRDINPQDLRRMEGLDAEVRRLNRSGVVPATKRGVVAEGAVTGGPLAFAYRPEGADDMTAEQELTARAVQGGVGLVAGAVLDFSVMKAGEWFGRARTALADRRLAKEAEAKGFASPEEYLASLVQFERTPDGVVVRPRPEALRALPGETDPLPHQDTPPTSELPPPRTEPGATEGAPDVAPGFVRFYHGGGTAPSGEPRWVSPDYAYARGYADKSDGDVYYVDIPEDSPLLNKAFDDSGTSSAAPYVSFEVPPEVSRGFKLYKPAAAAPRAEPVPDRTPALRRQQADEYDRLARATTDPAIRQELLRQAQTLRAEAQGEAPRRARQIDTERDDIITAIRKLGGLDVATETDWAGRLSHLPRRGFGLPGIEQTRGGGRTLDGLAEVLHEFGYLSRRDLTELEEKLSRAETGAELFSLHKQNYDEPERPRPSSTDRDWTYGEVDDVRALDQDFVIDTDNGTVIPARPFDEDDWVRLLEEERNAERFFEAEAGADVEPRGDGAPGVSARLADTLQGRERAEPEPGGSFGLPGVESRSPVRQGLADLERTQDLRRNGRRDVAPDEGPGDLFSGRARQTDIGDFVGEDVPGAPAGAGRSAGRRADAIADDAPDDQLDLLFDEGVAPAAREAARRDALEVVGPRVRHIETGSFPAGTRVADSPGAVAHIVAPLRREAQESFLAVITDGDDQVLRIARLHKGRRDSASVDPGLIAGAAANTPGARRVWFVHNHPSGRPKQSQPDIRLTEQLHKLLRGSGVEPQGMIVVAPGGRYSHFHPQGGAVSGAAPEAGPGARAAERYDFSREASDRIPAARRTERVPTTERVLRGRTPDNKAMIATADQARSVVRELAQGREGVVLLDGRNRPAGFLPMSAADMAQLRQGDGGPAQRLLAALDETNAAAFIAKLDGDTAAALERDLAMRFATNNLAKFSRAHGARLLDVLDDAGRSAHERNAIPDNPGTEFYANPFVKAFADTAREAVRYPGRTGAEAFVGATAGGTTSDEEVGSPLWWLDVARGATLGVAFFQGARGARLIGKGSIAARSYERLGAAIERLPFLGRGPAELREFKRKQRVMRALMDRQTEAVGRELLARFTPAERAMMADLIESRGIIQDFNIVHRQAQALDDFIADAAERMKALGMLPEDLETGGYLHRYYAKHLGIGDKLFRQAKGQTLSGSYTIARGTDGSFDRNYLSPAARRAADDMDALLADQTRLERELKAWERRADRAERGDDPDLFLEKYREAAERIGEELDEIRAQLQALRKTELVEYTGIQGGQLRSFLFARDEVPRVDPGLDPRLAQEDRPDVKPGDLAAQRLPEAPGVEQLTETGRVWRLRGSDRKGVLMHRDWTKAERQAWGEIEDAGYRYVRGMAEVSHDLSLATLYSTVARRGDWVKTLEGTADAVIDGQKWVYVPDTKVDKGSPLRKYGQLAGKHVRADVWNGIRNYGRPAFAPGRLGTLYRQALSKWKLYKTVYNPVTHLNNTYSNFEMLYMGGYQARDVARALNIARKGEADALWREARDAGLFGTDWTSSLVNVDGGGSQVIADLAEQLRTQPEIPDAALSTSIFMDVKDWWINSRNAVRDAPTKLASGAEVARALAAPAIKGAKFINRPIKAAARGAQRLYRFEDEVFKLAVYQAERRAGKSPEEAVQIAERYFFDYNDLPEAVKWVRDLPVGAPFVSYTYFAIPAIARNIVERPERVLALAAAYEAWNFAALQATGDGLGPGEYWAVEADMETISPPWERGRALWGARNTVMLPSPEGYRLALGRAHALGNPFMSEAGGREKLPSVPYLSNFWGSSVFGSNPLHALLDVMVNEDWKGKEIYQPGDTVDDKAAKAAAYLYQAWAPSNILTPGGYHQTRIIEGMANDVRQARETGESDGLIAPVVDLANRASEALGFGQFTGLDRADNEIDTRDALLGSFGIKLRPLRLGQSADFEMDAIERELQIHDKVIRRAARETGEGRRTDAQFEATRDKQFSEIDRLLERRDEIAGAKQRLDERGILR